MEQVKLQVRNFIIENFLFGVREAFDDDTSFLDEGIIDSTGVLELVNFMETAFPIKVSDEELIPENLDSVNNIAAYVSRSTAPAEKAV